MKRRVDDNDFIASTERMEKLCLIIAFLTLIFAFGLILGQNFWFTENPLNLMPWQYQFPYMARKHLFAKNLCV